MAKPQPQKAFIAAFFALMVVPLLAFVGVRAFALVLLGSGTSQNGSGWLFVTAAVVWVVIVLVVAFMVLRRLIRNTRA